jgi:hypothetical protein
MHDSLNMFRVFFVREEKGLSVVRDNPIVHR